MAWFEAAAGLDRELCKELRFAILRKGAGDDLDLGKVLLLKVRPPSWSLSVYPMPFLGFVCDVEQSDVDLVPAVDRVPRG